MGQSWHKTDEEEETVNVLTQVLKTTLLRYDPSPLDADVSCTYLKVHPWSFQIEARDVVVQNPRLPEGYFASQFVAKARSVWADIDVPTFVSSKGKRVEISRLAFQRVEAVYEKLEDASNVEELATRAAKLPPSLPGTHINIGPTEIADVSYRVYGPRGLEPRVPLRDITYEHFSTETQCRGDMAHIVQLLLGVVLRSVASSATSTGEACCNEYCACLPWRCRDPPQAVTYVEVVSAKYPPSFYRDVDDDDLYVQDA